MTQDKDAFLRQAWDNSNNQKAASFENFGFEHRRYTEPTILSGLYKISEDPSSELIYSEFSNLGNGEQLSYYQNLRTSPEGL